MAHAWGVFAWVFAWAEPSNEVEDDDVVVERVGTGTDADASDEVGVGVEVAVGVDVDVGVDVAV